MQVKGTALIRRARPLALALLAATLPMQALAHGAQVQAEAVFAISLQARYDTGEPMALAQVVIYAPDAVGTAWARGTTDAAGRYLFAPDPALPGRWTIQVRQAGHGAIVHLETGGASTAAHVVRAAAPAQGTLQKAVMVALVIWGALGTVLFLRSKRRAEDASA